MKKRKRKRLCKNWPKCTCIVRGEVDKDCAGPASWWSEVEILMGLHSWDDEKEVSK